MRRTKKIRERRKRNERSVRNKKKRQRHHRVERETILMNYKFIYYSFIYSLTAINLQQMLYATYDT